MEPEDTEEVRAALSAAREAYAAATEALANAEDAARAAGAFADRPDGTTPELRVQRIRVVEPDGTTRMIIGNSSMSGIIPMRGKEQEHPGRGTFGGILFCNNEGTEAGGLVYAGETTDGEPRQMGFWTVDDFEQNEGFRLGASQVGDERAKWIEFADQPYFSLADFMAAAEGKTGDELEEVKRQFWPPDVDGNGIVWVRLSKETDGSVALSLRDAVGVERIRLAVSADGNGKIAATAADGTEHSLFSSETLDSRANPLPSA